MQMPKYKYFDTFVALGGAPKLPLGAKSPKGIWKDPRDCRGGDCRGDCRDDCRGDCRGHCRGTRSTGLMWVFVPVTIGTMARATGPGMDTAAKGTEAA